MVSVTKPHAGRRESTPAKAEHVALAVGTPGSGAREARACLHGGRVRLVLVAEGRTRALERFAWPATARPLVDAAASAPSLTMRGARRA